MGLGSFAVKSCLPQEVRSLGGVLEVDATALKARYTCVDMEAYMLWRYPVG